nr:RsiV family protein [Hymenobacter properus]
MKAGEFLTISDLLRPGAERVLCHLLTRHLATEQDFPADALRQTADYPGVTFAPLPESGFGLEEKGLVFQYGDYEIGGYVDGTNSMTIEWAELLTLLNPESAVARMLRERGLWRAAD